MIPIVVLTIAALIVAAAYICYRLGFSVPKQTEADLFKFPTRSSMRRSTMI